MGDIIKLIGEDDPPAIIECSECGCPEFRIWEDGVVECVGCHTQREDIELEIEIMEHENGKDS